MPIFSKIASSVFKILKKSLELDLKIKKQENTKRKFTVGRKLANYVNAVSRMISAHYGKAFKDSSEAGRSVGYWGLEKVPCKIGLVHGQKLQLDIHNHGVGMMLITMLVKSVNSKKCLNREAQRKYLEARK